MFPVFENFNLLQEFSKVMQNKTIILYRTLTENIKYISEVCDFINITKL